MPERREHPRRAVAARRRAGPSHPPVPEYVVQQVPCGGWRWWLRGPDAEVVAASARTTPTPAGANLEALRTRMTAATAPTDLVTDRYGGWRWRLLTRAGRVVAVSAFGFASHWAAERALDRFRHEASHAELLEEPRPDIAARD